MSRISGRNTKPEIIVRKALHRMGLRFRINVNKLPGKPDIVLPKHKKIIFVHGCFWHGHKGCQRSKRPSSNQEFWDRKISRTIERDSQITDQLQSLGWATHVIWGCEAKLGNQLTKRLEEFIQGNLGKL